MSNPPTALLLTASKRPYYFSPVLESWQNARGISSLNRIAVALGPSIREQQMWKLIMNFPQVIQVIPDRIRGAGLHRAIGEGIDYLFKRTEVERVIYSEEDIVVSDDIIEYFTWGLDKFEGDPQVLAVCAHTANGAGWNEKKLADDADADQSQVRLRQNFSAWGWATWKDRWVDTLKPTWDWDCTSGGAMDSGWDWNVATRVIPQGNYVCAIPDASRSQNIGELEGWASTAESHAFAQTKSFRPHREPVNYEIIEDTNDNPAGDQ